MKRFLNHRIAINYLPATHIPQLDGVRGLAIFLVLLFHCYPFIAPARLGWLGVDLFFVLSGFLITGILWDTKAHKNYYKNFLVRRMVRIFPLYYTFLVLFFFGIPLLTSIDIANFQNVQGWYWLYATNWLFVFELQDWIEGVDINHFWSLAIEEQFYLFWPFVIFLFSRNSILKIILGFIALSFLLRLCYISIGLEPLSMYVSTFTRVDSLVIGAGAALFVRDEKLKFFLERHLKKTFLLSAFLIVSVIVITRTTSPYSFPFITFGYTVNALFFISILLLTLTDFANGFFKKIGLMRPLQFLGKYSYALYVFHLPLYSYFDHRWYTYFMGVTEQHFISRMLSSSLVIVLTVGISLISWQLIEKPFLRIKKYFKY